MAEALNLAAPDQAKPGTTKYQVKKLVFDRGIRWDAATSALVADPTSSEIQIVLIGEGGITREFWYTGVTADNLMKTLNNANNSTKSMHRRTLEKLNADGLLNGTTFSGSPDA